MTIGQPALSRREIARVLFRFKRRGFLVFVGCISLVVLALAICPRKYTSEAKLLVRLGRENVALDPTATTGAVVIPNGTRESEINSVLEVLRSRSNIEKVFDRITPNASELSPIARDRGVADLTKDISIYAPQTSNVVVLACEADTPERAQEILKLLLEVCLNEHLRVNRTAGSYDFFGEQAQLLKKQLDQASSELRDAKNKFGLVTLEGRRTALEQQLSNVKAQLRESEAALAASEAKTQHLKQSMDGLPSTLVQQHIGGVPNNALGTMRQKLYELQTVEQELLSKYSETHPKVVAVRHQVREAKRILAAETPKHTEAVKAVVATELANAASITARIESLQEQQKQLDVELQELNSHDMLVTQLERKARMLDANYVTYITGLEQARIDQALKREGISNISVVQEPTFAPKPSRPKKGLTLAASFIVASIGALGTMLASNHLDQSLKSLDDVEQLLGIPVLASIPQVEFDMERITQQPKHEGYLQYAGN